MRESAEFSAAYTAEVERKFSVGSREYPNHRGASLSSNSPSELSADYAAYADAQASDFSESFQSDSHSGSAKVNVKVFENSSPEFIAAVSKISPEILRLMQTQFHSVPARFVEGAIILSEPEEPVSSESLESDLTPPPDSEED